MHPAQRNPGRKEGTGVIYSLVSALTLQGERVLIFSQFTSMLNILEVLLDLEGHSYLRLDGQTPVVER